MANIANVAATFMEHLCECDEHGYSQSQRWGNANLGSCWVECEGHTGEFYKGDRDCSSAVCDAWQTALQGTGYEGALNGATYTGNMRDVFVNSGLFEWHDMSFSASRGDIYLNEQCHTAMCLDGSADHDILGQFSISETGGIYGQSGDQTGGESNISWYYDYPWDGILHYNGGADDGAAASVEESDETSEPQSDSNESSSDQPRYNIQNSDGWCGDMIGLSDTTGTSDNFAGNYGNAALYIAIDGVSKYRVESQDGGILDWVDHYDTNDTIYGCAGDGSPITKIWIPDADIHYQAHTINGEWLPEMIGEVDTGGSSDDFSGNGNPIDCVRIWKE